MATMKKAQDGAKTSATAKMAAAKGFKSIKDPDFKPSGKKYKNGGSLGMKSVKSGYDKNPSVTRADIITAAKGKAKNGKTMKKAQNGVNTLLPGGYAPKSREERYNNYPSTKPKPKAKAKPKSSIQEATPEQVKKYGMIGSQQAKSGAKMKKCKTGCK
jgi:hypothetical protein